MRGYLRRGRLGVIDLTVHSGFTLQGTSDEMSTAFAIAWSPASLG
jgi:hypothetical protein